MKVLFDTNVLIAAMIETHSRHSEAIQWLIKTKEKKVTGVISAHTLAELYSVLTTLPVFPRITPLIAYRLIEHNLFPHFEIIELTREDYQSLIKMLADHDVKGGATYDALIAEAASKVKVDVLLTLNPAHFIKVHPAVIKMVREP
jgi:predicted nucleic acid-binding protein